MEIIRKSENISAADLYSMTKGNQVRKMADAKGEVLDLQQFVIYKDTNSEGEETIVLSVKTIDGAYYATNSKTFIRNFMDIVAIFEESGEQIPTRYAVGSGRSNAGRQYLTCDIAQ